MKYYTRPAISIFNNPKFICANSLQIVTIMVLSGFLNVLMGNLSNTIATSRIIQVDTSEAGLLNHGYDFTCDSSSLDSCISLRMPIGEFTMCEWLIMVVICVDTNVSLETRWIQFLRVRWKSARQCINAEYINISLMTCIISLYMIRTSWTNKT